MMIAPVLQRPLQTTDKTVGNHFIGSSSQTVSIVLQTVDEWKEIRRTPGPAVPGTRSEINRTVRVPEPIQFGSRGVHSNLQAAIFYFMNNPDASLKTEKIPISVLIRGGRRYI